MTADSGFPHSQESETLDAISLPTNYLVLLGKKCLADSGREPKRALSLTGGDALLPVLLFLTLYFVPYLLLCELSLSS